MSRKLTLESIGVIAIGSAFLAQTIYFQTRFKVPTQNLSAQIDRNLHVLEEIRNMHVETDTKLSSIATSLEVRLSPGTYQLLQEKVNKKREQTRVEANPQAANN